MERQSVTRDTNAAPHPAQGQHPTQTHNISLLLQMDHQLTIDTSPMCLDPNINSSVICWKPEAFLSIQS